MVKSLDNISFSSEEPDNFNPLSSNNSNLVKGILDENINEQDRNIDYIKQLLKKYPELSWLTGDTNATPEWNSSRKWKTYWEKIFKHLDGKVLTEFNRTIMWVLTMIWVLEWDYENFTNCQKNNKLTKESFFQLVNKTKELLKDDTDIEAMIVYMVINDLWKIKNIVKQAKEDFEIQNVDHDKILQELLEKNPEISPSFQKLDNNYKELILEWLKVEFNLWQFIQWENLPANLSKLKEVNNEEALKWYLLHIFYDIAGVAWHIVQNWSPVITEETYQWFNLSIESLKGLQKWEDEKAVYNNYLKQRAEKLWFNINNKEDRALTRISCMLRYFDEKESEILKDVFNSLEENTKNILIEELNKNWIDDSAILLYYSPALLVNILNNNSITDDKEKISLWLKILAKLYSESRKNIYEEEIWVKTFLVSDIAEQAKANPKNILSKKITFEKKWDWYEVKLKNYELISYTPDWDVVKWPDFDKKAKNNNWKKWVYTEDGDFYYEIPNSNYFKKL